MLGLFKKKTDTLFEAIKAAYELRWVESDQPIVARSVQPPAWMGQVSEVPFTLRNFGRTWELISGELFPIIDVELKRVYVGLDRQPSAFPEETREIIDFPGEPLRSTFFVHMIGHLEAAYLGPQLREPPIETSLMRLSGSVSVVTFYRRGLELRIDRSRANRESFDGDLAAATEIARLLQLRHSATPGAEIPAVSS